MPPRDRRVNQGSEQWARVTQDDIQDYNYTTKETTEQCNCRAIHLYSEVVREPIVSGHLTSLFQCRVSFRVRFRVRFRVYGQF